MTATADHSVGEALMAIGSDFPDPTEAELSRRLREIGDLILAFKGEMESPSAARANAARACDRRAAIAYLEARRDGLIGEYGSVLG